MSSNSTARIQRQAYLAAFVILSLSAVEVDENGRRTAEQQLRDMTATANAYSADSAARYRANAQGGGGGPTPASELEKSLREAHKEYEQERLAQEARTAERAAKERQKLDEEKRARDLMAAIAARERAEERAAWISKTRALAEKAAHRRPLDGESAQDMAAVANLLLGGPAQRGITREEATGRPANFFGYFHPALALYEQSGWKATDDGKDESHRSVRAAAMLLKGHGMGLVREWREYSWSDVNPWGKYYGEYVPRLTGALVSSDGDLNPEQRRLAMTLVAPAMRLPSISQGKSQAFFCVLAVLATQTPEYRKGQCLSGELKIDDQLGMWKQGVSELRALPVAPDDFVPLNAEDLSAESQRGFSLGECWPLVAGLVLGDARQHPCDWFSSLRRDFLKLGSVNIGGKDTAQRALDDWFARCQVAGPARRAMQADFELLYALKCVVSEPWDARGDLFHRQERQAEPKESDPEFSQTVDALLKPAMRHPGAVAFVLQPHLPAAQRHLAEAIAKSACARVAKDGAWLDTMTRAWVGLHLLTDYRCEPGEVLSDLEIPNQTWERLVLLGEGLVRTGDRQWILPDVSARLARIRCDILDDQPNAEEWLEDPKHQPGAQATPDEWHAWAAIAGRPGAAVLARLHPEHVRGR